jgi:hypothetical protein
MDNPEKLATLDTQDEDKQEWTIQRNLQHWVHKTKTNKAEYTTQYVMDTIKFNVNTPNIPL